MGFLGKVAFPSTNAVTDGVYRAAKLVEPRHISLYFLADKLSKIISGSGRDGGRSVSPQERRSCIE